MPSALICAVIDSVRPDSAAAPAGDDAHHRRLVVGRQDSRRGEQTHRAKSADRIEQSVEIGDVDPAAGSRGDTGGLRHGGPVDGRPLGQRHLEHARDDLHLTRGAQQHRLDEDPDLLQPIGEVGDLDDAGAPIDVGPSGRREQRADAVAQLAEEIRLHGRGQIGSDPAVRPYTAGRTPFPGPANVEMADLEQPGLGVRRKDLDDAPLTPVVEPRRHQHRLERLAQRQVRELPDEAAGDRGIEHDAEPGPAKHQEQDVADRQRLGNGQRAGTCPIQVRPLLAVVQPCDRVRDCGRGLTAVDRLESDRRDVTGLLPGRQRHHRRHHKDEPAGKRTRGSGLHTFSRSGFRPERGGAIERASSNPKLQIPSSNHSQRPNPKANRQIPTRQPNPPDSGVGIWELGVEFGIW